MMSNTRKVFYTIFEHPEKWYLLWARSYDDEIWHVHAIYFPRSVANVDIDNTTFYKQDYGDFNRKFDSLEDTVELYDKKVEARLDHGYEIVRRRLPEDMRNE